MECVTRFRPLFYFKIRTHPGPWKTGLNIFELSSDFADFRTFKKLRGVHHTAERKLNIWKTSTVWCTPQRCIPWCEWNRRVWLRSMHLTAKSSSAVCIPPPSQTAHCWVQIEIFGSLWLLLKGQSGDILSGVNTSTMKEKNWRIFFFFTKMLTPWCHT